MAASQDPAFTPLPVIGNGDVLSWRDHEERLEQARELQLQQAQAEEGREASESQQQQQQQQQQQRWSTCCMLARWALTLALVLFLNDDCRLHAISRPQDI